MYYVYILKSIDKNFTYIGATNDLKRRYELHNSGKVTSTKYFCPLKLLYYEAFIDKNDAFAREQYLKTGWGRSFIKKVLKNSLSKNFGR